MKITVITVCRNSAATLQDTLESVLAQSWTGYEYLSWTAAARTAPWKCFRTLKSASTGG